MNYLDKYGDFVNENIFKKWSFEIDGIKVISQSESVHTGSRRSGTANFNKAKFEINDITLEIFSMLAVAKSRIDDKIPGCEITTTMQNGSLMIFIN